MSNSHSLDIESSSSQYAYITDASQTGLDLSTDYTFEAWIKLESLPSLSNAMAIIAKHSLADNQRGYQWTINSSDDKLYCDFMALDGTTWTRFIMDEAFDGNDLGTWIHIATSVDISVPSMKFYKNGVEKSCTAISTTQTTIPNNTANFNIGVRNNNSTIELKYDGLIDDVRVWSDIRSEAEIQANMYDELVGNEANLVGYWKLNNNYLDETSNNNDLTASGSPVFSTDTPVFHSASPSLSPSLSPSTSLSPSLSPSLSQSSSLSPSLSPSVSPSISLSLSPSLSPSYSPSVQYGDGPIIIV